MIWLAGVAIVVLALFGLTVLRGAPYVPTRRADIVRAFDELYILTKKDVLVDIGSGDGVVLREAAERGAHAIGYEINPLLVIISKWLTRQNRDITTVWADFWFVKFPDTTTVVYTFGESRDITKMYRKTQQEASRLKRPLWFVSYGFKIPNQLKAKSVGAHHLYKVSPLHLKGA